jgi:hypothetical protein
MLVSSSLPPQIVALPFASKSFTESAITTALPPRMAKLAFFVW